MFKVAGSREREKEDGRSEMNPRGVERREVGEKGVTVADAGGAIAGWTTVGRKCDGLRHGDPPVIRPVVGRTGSGRTATHKWSTLVL
jgi:hypothetical protein